MTLTLVSPGWAGAIPARSHRQMRPATLTLPKGFVPAVGRSLIVVGDEPDALLDRLAAYEAPAGPAWTTASES